ncbi:MAG: lipid kinase YegS [Sulfurovum sp.]|nr:MAG: lipid kinase YegS [Sulfurovum sp.]PHS41397.1 MAG: lipid kinase YegS [Sulfurovum sp.]
MIRIILNGKKASYDSVRSAISTLREEVEGVEVRVTYEYGDMEHFVNEAITDGIKRLVVGGGDGSVNEIVDAMAKLPREQRPELAILPLGTANDFASACKIPIDSLEALRLAVSGKTTSIDIAKANDRHFVNIATGGFGAKVTAETPVALKNFLGGGAYTLTGLIKALNFTPYTAKVKTPEFESEESSVLAAICNGKQAGGGQVLAPEAFINDGLLDVLIIKEVLGADIAQFLDEVKNPTQDGRYIKYFKTPWIESESEEIIPVNLDGEPYENKKIRFEIVPAAIDLVLPSDCPCLK